MQDRPSAAELAQAVREFIETEVLPGSTIRGFGSERSSRERVEHP